MEIQILFRLLSQVLVIAIEDPKLSPRPLTIIHNLLYACMDVLMWNNKAIQLISFKITSIFSIMNFQQRILNLANEIKLLTVKC